MGSNESNPEFSLFYTSNMDHVHASGWFTFGARKELPDQPWVVEYTECTLLRNLDYDECSGAGPDLFMAVTFHDDRVCRAHAPIDCIVDSSSERHLIGWLGDEVVLDLMYRAV